MTVITCRLMGGLGNQLFQIFATISYALEHGFEFEFTNAETLPYGTVRPTHWNDLLQELKPFTKLQYDSNYKLYSEPEYSYNKLPDFTQDTMICGYFQSEKYFSEYFDDIMCLTGINEQRDQINAQAQSYDLAIHFRITNYREIEEIHPVQKGEWYQKAYSLCQDSTPELKRVLVFCQPEDQEEVNNIINQYLQPISRDDVRFEMISATIPAWKQMLMMSCCPRLIIPNSTFSWWAAYISGSCDVWHPDYQDWYGPAFKGDAKDLIPNRGWTAVKAKAETEPGLKA